MNDNNSAAFFVAVTVAVALIPDTLPHRRAKS